MKAAIEKVCNHSKCTNLPRVKAIAHGHGPFQPNYTEASLPSKGQLKFKHMYTHSPAMSVTHEDIFSIASLLSLFSIFLANFH